MVMRNVNAEREGVSGSFEEASSLRMVLQAILGVVKRIFWEEGEKVGVEIANDVEVRTSRLRACKKCQIMYV